jgi:glycosyltransferase involved in cell wall biosynthesis
MSMPRPLVSIVTPSYNQAAFLEETIRSVLEQDYEPIEYVVVDGGSTDESVEVIRRYEERLAWWTSEPDGGQPQGLNKGFARSKGELMGYLNSDDTLLPGAVSRLVAELGRHPEALVAYGDAVFVDERGSYTHYGKSKVWGVGPMARVATGTVMPSASLWRRRAWELAGPFDESYQVWFDVLFFLNVARFGPASYVEEPFATYRIHPESKTANATGIPHTEELMRVADEFFGGPHLPEELRPHARDARAGYYRRAAWGYYSSGDIAAARNALLRSVPLRPRMSRKTARLLARTLTPEPVVRMRHRLAGRE